jgi:hypothetical protein
MIVLGMLGSAATVWGLWLTAAESGGKSLWIAFVVWYGVLAGGIYPLSPTTQASGITISVD